MSPAPMRSSPEPLTTHHDVALLDLDGVVYVGADPVPGVAEIVVAAAEAGMRFGYVTNNASRTPHEVAAHLRELGLAATEEEVITSAQAASRTLADALPGGSRVLVIGTTALAAAVEAAGLRAVWSAEDDPAGVVQGYSPQLSWAMLAEACVAIRAGALWVATNTDSTLPSPRGPLPGNGSFVDVVARTTGAAPLVTGKPEPAMHTECLLRTGARRPLVVGDRLDTDIEGAHRAGVPSLLVLSGVARPVDLLVARDRQRPTYLAADLGGLLVPHPPVERSGPAVHCGTWEVICLDDTLVLAAVVRASAGAAGTSSTTSSTTSSVDDGLDALRALAVLAWDSGVTRTDASDPAAAAVLDRLMLSHP